MQCYVLFKFIFKRLLHGDSTTSLIVRRKYKTNTLLVRSITLTKDNPLQLSVANYQRAIPSHFAAEVMHIFGLDWFTHVQNVTCTEALNCHGGIR